MLLGRPICMQSAQLAALRSAPIGRSAGLPSRGGSRLQANKRWRRTERKGCLLASNHTMCRLIAAAGALCASSVRLSRRAGGRALAAHLLHKVSASNNISIRHRPVQLAWLVASVNGRDCYSGGGGGGGATSGHCGATLSCPRDRYNERPMPRLAARV